MKTTRQPGHQTGLGGAQIDTTDANLGESEFQGPSPNQGNQLTAVDVRGGNSHPPIVKSLVWQSELQTRLFACALAEQADLCHAFIQLQGDLGAGKTTLVRHLLHALGVTGRIKSPTYAVVEQYELPAFKVWHFDFYRFHDPREWEEAGFRDIFAGPGLKLAEWPEKAGSHLPHADLVLHIETRDDSSRQVSLSAQTPIGEALLQGIVQ